MMISLALAASLFLNQGYAPPRQGLDPLDAEKEARVQRLGKLFRCAVCQGVSIADSPASMARAQLDKVRELVAEGQTDEQIEAYMVARYGEWVLLKPKGEGATSALWVLPVLLLVGGLILVRMQVKKKPAAAQAALPGAPAAEAAKPVEDEYLAKVRADLGKQ